LSHDPINSLFVQARLFAAAAPSISLKRYPLSPRTATTLHKPTRPLIAPLRPMLSDRFLRRFLPTGLLRSIRQDSVAASPTKTNPHRRSRALTSEFTALKLRRNVSTRRRKSTVFPSQNRPRPYGRKGTSISTRLAHGLRDLDTPRLESGLPHLVTYHIRRRHFLYLLYQARVTVSSRTVTSLLVRTFSALKSVDALSIKSLTYASQTRRDLKLFLHGIRRSKSLRR
jgi:hypothetical protein